MGLFSKVFGHAPILGGGTSAGYSRLFGKGGKSPIAGAFDTKHIPGFPTHPVSSFKRLFGLNVGNPPDNGPPPGYSDPNVAQAEQDERQRELRGRASTILTGARGYQGPSNLSSRMLFGVR